MSRKFTQFFYPRLYLLLVYLITFTCKKRWVGLDNIEQLKREKRNWIYTIWHNCIFISCWVLRKQDLTLLISNSKDGDMVAQAISFMGNSSIRGSSSKGGIKAFLQLIKVLRAGRSVALTPDGPRGPKYKLQSGAISLAGKSGVPLVPLHIQATRQWLLNSWDNHQIPKPFSTIVIKIGEPFYISGQGLSSEKTAEIQEQFEKLMLENVQKTQLIINQIAKK